MIPRGFYTQIATIILAGAIIITYVKPAFESIGLMQDDIEVYQIERDKVVAVNSRLAELVSDVDSVTKDEKNRLSVYLPDTIDEIAVQRDIWSIVQLSEVFFSALSYEGASETTQSDPDTVSAEGQSVILPQPHEFSLSVEGTYGQVKNLLSLLEQNEYPFELRNVSIQPIEGGFLTVELQLFTYSYRPLVIEEVIEF